MNNSKTNRLVKISILSTIALLLMVFAEVALPIFPDFLKFDISDVPAIFGAFAMGPAAGVAIEALKNVLHAIFKPGTMGLGELANFIVGSAFVYTAGMLYLRKKNKKHALLGLISGVIVMTLVAAVFNYFVLLPLYESILGFKITTVVSIAKNINPAINDLNSFILLSIVPFNLLKGIIVSIIVFVSYKSLSPVLHK